MGNTSTRFVAARLGAMTILKLLRFLGFEMNQDDGYGETPLLIAAKNGHHQMVKLLQPCAPPPLSSLSPI